MGVNIISILVIGGLIYMVSLETRHGGLILPSLPSKGCILQRHNTLGSDVHYVQCEFWFGFSLDFLFYLFFDDDEIFKNKVKFGSC